jgi:hypothetical protein
MSHTNGPLVAHGQYTGVQAASNAPLPSSSLDGIRRRIDQIANSVADLHGIADRACGPTAIAGDPNKAGPQFVPNGMLDEIDKALDSLVNLSNTAVARLSRIA